MENKVFYAIDYICFAGIEKDSLKLVMFDIWCGRPDVFTPRRKSRELMTSALARRLTQALCECDRTLGMPDLTFRWHSQGPSLPGN
jgi:hypothetical protein